MFWLDPLRPFLNAWVLKSPSLSLFPRIHEKVEAFERSDDNYFTKAVEDFTSRAKKLEDDLLRYPLHVI